MSEVSVTKIVNFRDVGLALSSLGSSLLEPELLYRGGRLTNVTQRSDLLNIPTILNLRPQKNPRSFPATWLRAPAANTLEVYDTTSRATRAWINKALGAIATPGVDLPIYIHCTSGKDRTGVVVAALLRVLGVSQSLICQEYLLSEGEVSARRVLAALDGMGEIQTYLRKVDLEALRSKFSPS